eukprot:TRINITY_DN4844_c0_g1_i1.p1 TRINITY_DN4844_c0_g1~~TRINITY_DN4844_c0_g1_i1.p1  ORF type:complete len:331 (+),score=35.80 TRINITY_DN4844_c0_g1_i1:16-1008(+)
MESMYNSYIARPINDTQESYNILFVFPKEFEFAYFVKESDAVIYDVAHDIYRVYTFKDNIRRMYACTYFNESDCIFYEKLIETINRIKPKFACLLGSCGYTEYEPNEDQWYKIHTAIQADRGFLDSSNKFIFRIKKNETESCKLNSFYDLIFENIDELHTFSSNFLNQKVYNEYNGSGSGLYDMETYYFYSVCRQLNVPSYVCLRYVTDKILKEGEATEDILENLRETLSKLLEKNEIEVPDNINYIEYDNLRRAIRRFRGITYTKVKEIFNTYDPTQRYENENYDRDSNEINWNGKNIKNAIVNKLENLIHKDWDAIIKETKNSSIVTI